MDFEVPDVSDLTSARLLDEKLWSFVRWLEDLPQNQSGADKTWVERLDRETREMYRRAVRIR